MPLVNLYAINSSTASIATPATTNPPSRSVMRCSMPRKSARIPARSFLISAYKAPSSVSLSVDTGGTFTFYVCFGRTSPRDPPNTPT